MRFDFTDLRLFAHIAEHQSLTKGAEHACLSLPAASVRIRELENQLGVRLFYRTAKGVTLAFAGEEFLLHTRRILHAAELLQADMLKYDKNGQGHIRIFANTTAVTEFMPEILAGFLAEHPQVSIDLQERLTNEIVRGIREGAADIGVTSFSGKFDEDGIECTQFAEDRLVLVTPLGHALAKQTITCLRTTLAELHITLHEGSTLYDYLVTEAAACGLPLRLRMRVRGFESQCRMVEAGVGVAITPESAARRHQAAMRIEVVALSDDSAQRRRCVLVKAGQACSSQTQALIESIVAQGGNLS